MWYLGISVSTTGKKYLFGLFVAKHALHATGLPPHPLSPRCLWNHTYSQPLPSRLSHKKSQRLVDVKKIKNRLQLVWLCSGCAKQFANQHKECAASICQKGKQPGMSRVGPPLNQTSCQTLLVIKCLRWVFALYLCVNCVIGNQNLKTLKNDPRSGVNLFWSDVVATAFQILLYVVPVPKGLQFSVNRCAERMWNRSTVVVCRNTLAQIYLMYNIIVNIKNRCAQFRHEQTATFRLQ